MERVKRDIRENVITIEHLRNIRRQENLQLRKQAKFEKLLEKRLFNNPSPELKKHRSEILKEWREEKQKKQELEKKGSKVAFKYYNLNTKAVPIFQFELKKNEELNNCFTFCSKFPMKEIQNEPVLRRSERIKERNKNKIIVKKDFAKKKDIEKDVEKCRTAADFYQILDLNHNQLDELCKIWLRLKKIKKFEQVKLDNIDSILGQTQLLLDKKFKKFRNLVQVYEKCVFKLNSRKLVVNLNDLRGFWYELDIQIKKLKECFDKLHNNEDREIFYCDTFNTEKYKITSSIKKPVHKSIKNCIIETPKKRSSFGLISSRLSLMSKLVDSMNDNDECTKENEIPNQLLRL